jgi:hypothetical protein
MRRSKRKTYHGKYKPSATGRPSRAKKPPRQPGECSACGEIKPETAEFFVIIKNKQKDWQGLSSECRACRYQRYRTFYEANRAQQIKRAIAFANKYPERKNARDMARYAATIAPQQPAWADKRKIETIYAIADFLTDRTGIVHQVDHVYPLKGKTCCGLHTHQNMRVITAEANQRKGNRIPPEYDTWRSI